MNLDMLKLRIEKKIDHNQDINQFRKKLLTYHSFDLAQVFIKLEKKYQHRLYEILSPKEFALGIFSYIELEEQLELIYDMHKNYFALVLKELPTDEAVKILKEIEDADTYLKLMPNKHAATLKSLLVYDTDEAGSIMSTDFITVDSSCDIKEAMKILKEKCDCEVIDEIFVTENNLLIGKILLKDLIVARSPKKVTDIMKSAISIESIEKIDKALDLIEMYELKALPVVENGLIKGIICVDDWFDFIGEDVNLDYNMLAGISFNSNDNSIFSSIKKRIPWLLILLALSLIVSTIISGFDKIIAQVSVLVIFQSLVLDMGGNSGTQSLAVAVRNISNNSIENVPKYLFKELKIGFLNGIVLGVSSFVVTMLFLLIVHHQFNPLISLVVGIAMMLTMLISTLMGALTPIVFNKLKIDPAVASGPFISTLNDCLSVTIYYGIASILIVLGVMAC